MDKIQPGTTDGTEENIQKIAALFPEVMTEVADADGTLRHVVDYDALHELLGDGAEGQRERYQFTWPGKAAAKAEARKPIWKTMRPERERSVDWDTTRNLYIEGDNLDALKLLKEAYAGKVKLIYIDPPYNTGHDFVYDDDYRQTHEEYDAGSGEYDEDGGRLVANPDSNGRFHSDWCSMIYPRLVLARDLLSADGVIYISVDENESGNLRKICDEVFGADMLQAIITWQRKYSVSNNYVGIASMCDYLLVYSKSSDFQTNLLPRSDDSIDRYSNPDNDPRGPWKAVDYLNQATTAQRPNLVYDIVNPNTGAVIKNREKAWKYEKSKTEQFIKENRIWWGKDGTNTVPALKRFLSEVRDGLTPYNLWTYEEVGHTQEATKEVEDLFGAKVFDFPKPVRLLSRVVQLSTTSDSLIVDFFSGSATTAQAVFSMNARDAGHRRFILVQIPEETPENSVAKKKGFDTICQLGEERIRRAGAKVKAEVEEANRQLKLGEEPKPVPDIGFRVLRIDSSNIEDTYRTPGDTDQMDLLSLADNVKLDRSTEDLLFEVLPKFRIPYSARIERRELGGRECFLVDGNRLVACFDTEVGTETIEEMAKLEPDYAVMRDASMKDDATQANFEELFKTYSPDTVRRVI
ncbi:MAG: DNA methylase N-4/N-6 domain protein [Atopobium sp.]|jgi:adenine-specific DNA-methyltransferase